MKTVYRSLAEAKDQFGPCAVAIGNFDGVHLGHRTLIRQTRQVAWANGWKTANFFIGTIGVTGKTPSASSPGCICV